MATAEQLDHLLATLSGIDVQQAIADFKSGNPEVILSEGLLLAQVISGDVGYVVPAAATASKWIELFRAVLPFIEEAVKLLPPDHPHQLKPNEFIAFNSVFER